MCGDGAQRSRRVVVSSARLAPTASTSQRRTVGAVRATPAASPSPAPSASPAPQSELRPSARGHHPRSRVNLEKRRGGDADDAPPPPPAVPASVAAARAQPSDVDVDQGNDGAEDGPPQRRGVSVVVSDEYESTVPTIPTDRINLSAIHPESAYGNPELPPFISPDALINTIESLFAAHVQQAQERVYALSVGKVQKSDELVRAANARAEASDKARRKMQRKLDRVLAQMKRRKNKRVREGEGAESSYEESEESELSAGASSGEESE
ncbi:hypothetical protein RHOSPDRAFT_35243 [Rhodotorula sp. JG-1b]|nr:hypothetical protein RHOSPDRAFT_35243 [Rhodotorula sp. JG-1b]